MCLQCCPMVIQIIELNIPSFSKKYVYKVFILFYRGSSAISQKSRYSSLLRAQNRSVYSGFVILLFVLTECHVLKCLPYVQSLQQEAQKALMEFISTMFHGNLGRFALILQLITSLRDIDADAIEELFFRPILGEATLNVLLLETLYIKPVWLWKQIISEWKNISFWRDERILWAE